MDRELKNDYIDPEDNLAPAWWLGCMTMAVMLVVVTCLVLVVVKLAVMP